MNEPLIRYKNVEIHQQEVCVLKEVNLELNKGEFAYLIGKVGSGKTSLLKTFYAELDIASGEAEVLGCDMSFYMEKEGYSGMAHWLKRQWSEETGHACALAGYVIRRGGKAKVDKIDVVPNDFGTPLEVFEQVYKHDFESTV